MQRLTPTPAELEAFDSLIVYSNYRYRNHEKLGNLLADYVDAGMGVVTMPFENSTWLSKTCSMGGRWQTEGYSVFTTSGADCKRDASALGRIDLAGHPLTREFASLKGSYRLKVNPKTESTLVASWQDDLPLAAFNMSKGLIVGLNFYPGSNRVVSKSWDHKTDGWKLMANALEWTAANGSSHWLTANPMTASVIGGKNKSITLSFDAEKLTEGDYAAELRFQSNDPKNPYVTTKVSLEVRENQAPVAKPISLSLLEDNSKQFELLGEDPEKEPITFTILKQPKHGSLRGKAPDLTYEPNPEFNGNDEFVYRVSDGRKNSDSAIVSIFVQSVNDRPWAKPLEIETTEDTPVEIAFAYGDVDGDQLKLIFSRDPEGGFLWEDEGAWSYFPNPHFNGKDSFTFKVSDGISESSETEVSIVISATNDAPIAKNMEIKVNEDQSVTFDLDAVDVDGDKIQFELVSLPRHGELTQEGNRCVYLPYSDYNGKDSFRFCAADSKVRGNEAVVELTVTQKNDRPIIQPAHFKGMEDGKVQIKLIASDPDGDALTFRTITGPSSGTLEGNGTMYEYTPKKDFYGDDSFVVVANDGMLDSDPAKITVEVSGSNDAPQFAVMAENNSKASYRETPVCLPLKASDPDGDTLEFKIVSATANGECFVSGNEFIYYPSKGFTGNDEVVLGVSDGKLSDTIRLQLSIREHPNAIPIHLEGKDETELGDAFLHLMYELNGRLLEKGNPLFKLQATDSTLSSLNNERSKDDKLIGVRLSSEDASEDGTPPFEWIESMPDFEGAKFLSFNRLKNDLGEHWSVSPLFLPPFSTDKGVDNESSSSDQDMDESNK
ncbi:MAG: Ig-like domain-containing protein, partial [Opitutales bacterium]